MNYQCKICNQDVNHNVYHVKERMLGTLEEFNYFQCENCGCLQIAEIPQDISRYYSDNYYSFNIEKNKSIQSTLSAYLLKHALRKRITGRDIIGDIAIQYNSYYRETLPWLIPGVCNFNSRILDVGCGGGKFLLFLHKIGFQSLEGIDPYIPEEINHFGKIKISKKSLIDLTGNYDLIMMHHSFEHMSNPREIFQHLPKVLSPEGVVLIRIPLSDSYAFRRYRENWFQIDAPRHFFLHTVKSIHWLAEENGLSVEKIIYDSSPEQFIASEKYVQDISLFEKVTLSAEKIKEYNAKTKDLNSKGEGDQACFYLKIKG